MPNTQVNSPNDALVHWPGAIGIPKDGPRLKNLHCEKQFISRDTIQRSVDDGKLYRCLRQSIQTVWVQTLESRFNVLPTRMPGVSDISRTTWLKFYLPASITHGYRVDWVFTGYNIQFDINTRVYTMTVTFQCYSEYSKKGAVDSRELLDEQGSGITPVSVD